MPVLYTDIGSITTGFGAIDIGTDPVGAGTATLVGSGTTTTLLLSAADATASIGWKNGAGTLKWLAYMPTGTSLAFRDVVAAVDVFSLTPGTSLATFAGAIRERARTTAIGEWIAVSYAAGNFNVPTGTWTVSAGNQTTYRYTLVGKTMFLEVRLDGTTITGTPTRLRVTVPGTFTINATTDGLYVAQVNGVYQVASWEAQSGDTAVQFFSTVGFAGWAASASNNSIIAKLTLELQ